MADHTQRLNLGSGTNVGIGWINLDCNYDTGDRVVDEDGTRFIGANFYGDDLPFAGASVDGIVMNHSLQCLTHDQILPCLRECRRVLKPGGALRILVPDILAAFSAYDCRHDHWPGFDAITEDWDRHRKFAHYLTWGGSNRSCFTRDSLMDWLIDAGFTQVHGGSRPEDQVTIGPEWMLDLDSRMGESIVVEGW